MASFWLALRSLFWTVALPGMVAGYVPWRYVGLSHASFSWRDPVQLVGALFVTVGAAVLATCIWEFARSGRGTLSPVDPPKQLVVRGLYRYVRNPMYVGVTTMLLGELLVTRTTTFALYCAGWLVAVNLFIIGYEEPTLRSQFGASYEAYTKSVGRWIPRRPRRGSPVQPP
ncbi:MAG TPA: isoprenylcysteine carboxylmethyltransferase family protein [Gemmatimonadales bacterium]|nr:isoprenylcysteine carboxylmethyltransferase family protein [Gemmatimonadales bacterium]